MARTKDVIALALHIKDKGNDFAASSLLKSSVAVVPLGNVHILSLSFDQSTLAAAVGEHIHLFSVPSLLLDKVSSSIHFPVYLPFLSVLFFSIVIMSVVSQDLAGTQAIFQLLSGRLNLHQRYQLEKKEFPKFLPASF